MPERKSWTLLTILALPNCSKNTGLQLGFDTTSEFVNPTLYLHSYVAPDLLPLVKSSLKYLIFVLTTKFEDSSLHVSE